MAAATTYSSLFSSTGTPVAGRPFTAPVGLNVDFVSDTVPTTSLDDVGDFRGLIPCPTGKLLEQLALKWGQLDSSTGLTGDIVLRQTDKNGTNTDTVIYAGTTGFRTAQTTYIWVFPNQFISGAADADDVVVIGLKITGAATTAVQANLSVHAGWR